MQRRLALAATASALLAILPVFVPVLLLLGAAAPAAAQDSVVLSILPAEAQLQPGDSLVVELTVTNESLAFNAYDAFVTYDPERLLFLQMQPVIAQEGPLMTEACPQRFHIFTVADDSTYLEINHSLLCAAVNVTGPGVVYRLRFQAREQTGTTLLGLGEGTAFYDEGLYVTPVLVEGAEITIGEVTDVSTPTATERAAIHVAPNPFNPATTISCTLPRAAAVTVRVHALDGSLVSRLYAGSLGAGLHRFQWLGQDVNGRAVASGRYVVVMQGDGLNASRTVTLVR